MSELKEDIEALVDDVQAYSEAKIDQFQLDAMEKTIVVASKVITWLVIAIVAVLALVSLSVVGGLMLSELLDSYLYGFATLSAFYLLLFLLFILRRGKWLDYPIKNALFGAMLSTYTKKDE